MIPQSISKPIVPEFSFDGYVRLTFDAFTRLTFPRKSAWEDSELRHELCAEYFPACRAGYCEWETGERNAVSVGWAWFAIADGKMFIAPGYVNSNLMLVTQESYDLGAFKTSELLRAWLSSLHWQPERILEQL
jgi:hypothetical protein